MSASLPAYLRWLADAPPRAEIMRGARTFSANATGADLARAEPPARPRFGGYDEDRSVYTQALFGAPGEEPRTLHLGLDVFAPAESDVFAPLAGRLHSFADNAQPGDYGPTIILEHRPAPGLVFHTLYGHLSRDSIRATDMPSGRTFSAGDRIARLGGWQENGGWPPHLHFQVILDIEHHHGDYPGVARRSERAQWLARCPDPRPLLGL